MVSYRSSTPSSRSLTFPAPMSGFIIMSGFIPAEPPPLSTPPGHSPGRPSLEGTDSQSIQPWMAARSHSKRLLQSGPEGQAQSHYCRCWNRHYPPPTTRSPVVSTPSRCCGSGLCRLPKRSANRQQQIQVEEGRQSRKVSSQER